MTQDSMREQLSALIDGEGEFRAHTAQAAAFVRLAAADEAARRDWLLYAQIGDVLRSADLTPMPREQEFLQRVSAAIAREPIVLQPAVTAAKRDAPPHRRPHWSTRLAAGLAAVGGVAVMAWVALPGLQHGGQESLRAARQSAVTVSTGALAPSGGWQVRVSETRLDDTAQALVPPPAGLVAAGGNAAAVAMPQRVAMSAQMPMVEYLLAHQQMAGSMMPVVPATLRVVADRPAAPAAPAR
ncbi:MAG: RseA family anti-sigma factor [Thiomonas sp.]